MRAIVVGVFFFWWSLPATAQTRVLSISKQQQALVLRYRNELVVLEHDQPNSALQLQLVRVHASGADLRFLNLPDGELTVRVERGTDLDELRKHLTARPKVPATISVPILLDPATGLPRHGNQARQPASDPVPANARAEPKTESGQPKS